MIRKNTPQLVTQEPSYIQKLLVSLFSGILTGVITSIIFAPLDVAKARIQIQGSLGIEKYSGSILNVVFNIYSEEGISGLFLGLGPTLFTISLFWGIYWPIYDFLKHYLKIHWKSLLNHQFIHIVSAVIAGAVGDVITNPFWIIRTRIQTKIFHTTISPYSYSIFESLYIMYKEEGFSSLFRGLDASLLGLTHVAVQFPLYEFFNELARNRNHGSTESFFDLTLSSIVSKILASTITYPHEVLRSRLQDSSNHDVHFGTLLIRIIREEGIFALWTGLDINIIRLIPNAVLTFVTYEYISRFMNKKINHFFLKKEKMI